MIYADWDISYITIPKRSYLYSLPPIGIGTPAVESLTGYVARLAEAHAVGAGTLVNHVLLPRIPLTNGLFAGQPHSTSRRYWGFEEAHSLNGVGVCPRHWVSLLQELTGVEHLDLLTMLPWADRLSRVHLLRETRAWCPDCYQSWCTAELPVYEPLLWMFQIVTVCPFHRRALEQICPACGRTQYVFSSKSRPGFCSRCQSRLVRNQTAAMGFETADCSLSEQIWVAEKVSELLAASQWGSARASGGIFRENVRQCVNASQCTLKLLHDITQVHVRLLLSSTGIPRIDTLLKLCGLWRISPLRFLTEPIPPNDQVWRCHIVADHGSAKPFKKPSAVSLHPKARRFTGVPRTVVLRTLEDALAKDSCTLLREVAASLGLRSMRRFYTEKRSSELAHAIAAKNAKLKKRSHDVESWGSMEGAPPASTCANVGYFAGVPRAVVRKRLEDALAKDSYTRLKAVAASVGLNDTKRFYMEKPLSDLAHAIAAKNAELKRRGNTLEDPALTEALNRAMASSRAKIKRPCVPRAVVQKELEDALAKDTYTSLNAVAASMGFRSTARFYKEKCFSDLAHAIVAKNAELWKSAHTVEDATHLPGVPRAVVRRALEDALAKDSNTTVVSVAASLGLRSTRRFYREKPLSDLAHAIAAKNAELWKRAYTVKDVSSPWVPRAVVQRELEAALAKDSYISLTAVAASLGLRSPRRFYKEKRLSDLARAILVKNAELKKRVYLTTTQTECRAQSIRKIEQQVGHGSNLITKGLSAEPALPSDSLAFRLACRQAYRLNDAHKELEAALLEDPAPAFSTVLKRLIPGPQTIRDTFPRLCRCLRDRYRQQKAHARAKQHKAFTADVREALALLQHADLQPTLRRVLQSIRSPRFRGYKIVRNAINVALQELST